MRNFLLVITIVCLFQDNSGAFRPMLGFFKQSNLADPYWAQTISLLRCDSGSLSDLKGRTYTNSGVASSMVQAKFGVDSCYFDGGSYLNFDVHNSFATGTSNMTLEGWVYPAAAGFTALFGSAARTGAGLDGYGITSDYGILGNYQTALGGQVVPLSLLPPANQWSHVALVRNGTTMTYYLNGNSVGSTTISSSYDLTSNYFVIGTIAYDQINYNFTGYMEEIRVTSVARYTGNFTVPASPFSAF